VVQKHKQLVKLHLETTKMIIRAVIISILAQAVMVKLHQQQATTTNKAAIRIIIIISKLRIKMLSLTNNPVMTPKMITQTNNFTITGHLPQLATS